MNLKKSMGIDYKKLFSFAVIFMFLFAFSMSFVVAADGDGETGSDGDGANVDDQISNFISKIFQRKDGGLIDGWNAGEVNAGFAKVLFLALISMLVYSVIGLIPGVGEKEFVKIGAAVIIGVLSTWGLNPSEVISMMTGYDSLGMTLGGFLPMIILLFFTISMATSNGGAKESFSRRLMATLMWIAFAIFSTFKLFGVRAEGGSVMLSLVFVIASWVMAISVGRMFKMLKKGLMKEAVDKSKENLEKRKALKKGQQLEFDFDAGLEKK